jgi:hypothetical protein
MDITFNVSTFIQAHRSGSILPTYTYQALLDSLTLDIIHYKKTATPLLKLLTMLIL